MIQLPEKISKEVEDYIKEKKLPKAKADKLRKEVLDSYEKKLYSPEEAMGIIAAQSLSEPATQMTMRTYHFAGTAGIQVTLGLPRLLEIYDAKKEPDTPAMTIYIKKKYQKEAEITKIAEIIKEVKLKDIVTTSVMDIINLVVKFKLNEEKLKRLGLELKKVPSKIKIKNINVSLNKNELSVASKKENVNMHKLRYKILESHVSGIKNISQIIVQKDEIGEWVIHTLGSNLKKVCDIEGVDGTQTTTNNIFEIYDVFGIEAARNAIIKESMHTIEEQGLGVDIRYVMLLADLMTSRGGIMGIGRYGIAGNKPSILARASFEETKKHVVEGAVKGISDNLSGSVENIIMNKVAPMGTGSFTLVGKVPKIPADLKKMYEKQAEEAKKRREAAEEERKRRMEEVRLAMEAEERGEMPSEETKEEKEESKKEESDDKEKPKKKVSKQSKSSEKKAEEKEDEKPAKKKKAASSKKSSKKGKEVKEKKEKPKKKSKEKKTKTKVSEKKTKKTQKNKKK